MINRINKYLNNVLGEEYFTTLNSRYLVHGNTKDVDIFINPSDKEFLDVLKDNVGYSPQVRYLIYDNNVYIWSGSRLLHTDVFKYLGLSYSDYPKNMYGVVTSLDDYKYIKNIVLDKDIGLELLPEQEDSFLKKAGAKLGREAAGLAGDLATGLLRGFVPTPTLAGLSGVVGETISDELIDYFDKLFMSKKYLKTKVKNNGYYNKGYDKYKYDIPEIEIPLQEMNRVREYLIPPFKKFGYKIKIVGFDKEDKSYLILIFTVNSKYPNMDIDRNPIIYPLPLDIFHKIIDKESSFVVVYDWLKLFDVPIRKL